jgi:predicted aspartyl protease
MAHDRITRRQSASLLAAALLCPLSARAGGDHQISMQFSQASRLQDPGAAPYEPPANLSAVADLFRRMTIGIRINDSGPFGFVVDTGANQSVVSAELVAQLSLPRGAAEPLNGVAGVQITDTTSARLTIGKRVLPNAVFSILPAGAIGGAGLLGLDSLGDQALTLDFAGKTLRIETQQSNTRDPAAIALKATRRDGQLTLVDADLAGVPIVAFLDSGAQNTIGNLALRQIAFKRNPKTLWAQTPIVSATGQTILAEVADLPALRVGGIRVPNWPVAFADLHTFQMWKLTDRPAILLGVDILSRFQYVCLDFARGEVRFRLPSHSA